MTSKYDRLGDHLRSLTSNTWTASFADLERMLGFPLPFSARNHQAWWGNNRASPQACSWLDAGWKVGNLRQLAETVVFERASAGAAPRHGLPIRQLDAAAAIPPQAAPKPPKRELPPYPWDTADGVDYRIRFRWEPIGRVLLDEKELPAFPAVPPTPGLYRFQIRGARGHATYIGEAEDLRRRFQGYRTPSVGQLTNVRVRDRLLEALREEDEVAVAIVISGAELVLSGDERPVDLGSKQIRLILENAALVAGASDTVESLNR